MSVPTIIHDDTAATGTTTAPQITLPGSPAVLAGDIIICGWAVAGPNTTGAPVVPSGFTELVRSGTTVGAVTVGAIIATGGEEGDTFTPAAATASRAWVTWVYVVRGGTTDLSYLLDDGSVVAATTTRPVLGVTTTVADTLVLAGAAVEGAANTLTDPGTPWTPDDQAASTSSYASAIHATQASPGATDTGAWTAVSSGKWARWTVAIPPPTNQPPEVDSISPAYIVTTVGEECSATALASDDGTVVSYAWSQQDDGTDVEAPALSGENTATVTFTSTEVGAFTLQVIATDNGDAESEPAYLPVLVIPSAPAGLQVRVDGGFVPASPTSTGSA